MVGIKLHAIHFLALAASALSFVANAETQNALTLSVPTYSPGTSGALTASVTDGFNTAGTGTLTYTYSGHVKLDLSNTSATGRFSTLGSVSRMGLSFDSFLLFQSFLDGNYLTVGSSNSNCPNSGTLYEYNWLIVRYRTPDLTRNPNNMSSTSFFPGGTINYDTLGTSLLTGVNSFDMAGPTSNTTLMASMVLADRVAAPDVSNCRPRELIIP